MYKTRITDLDDLKHRASEVTTLWRYTNLFIIIIIIRIRTEWAKLDHAVIAAAVRQWRRRLSACVRIDSGHFEHCF